MKNINFTMVNNDYYGNPRYVCHYSDLLTRDERAALGTID